MKHSLYKSAGIIIFSVLLFPLLFAASPMLQDGDHRHFYLETSIAQVRIEANSTNARQGTQIAALQATQQVLPSPTLITATWTRTPTKTNTPPAVPPTPTQEDFQTPSNTPVNTFTPIPTVTPQITATAATPPFLDPDFICEVKTTDNLTKRLTASPGATSLGILPSGSVVKIAPYLGSIPYTTTAGLWYVPVVTENASGVINFDEIAYYILYARTTPPSEATPGFTPTITETFLNTADPQIPCIPVIIRN